jgi:hypothetical protein
MDAQCTLVMGPRHSCDFFLTKNPSLLPAFIRGTVKESPGCTQRFKQQGLLHLSSAFLLLLLPQPLLSTFLLGPITLTTSCFLTKNDLQHDAST